MFEVGTADIGLALHDLKDGGAEIVVDRLHVGLELHHFGQPLSSSYWASRIGLPVTIDAATAKS
jgi:hypothetical protein